MMYTSEKYAVKQLSQDLVYRSPIMPILIHICVTWYAPQHNMNEVMTKVRIPMALRLILSFYILLEAFVIM